MLAYRLALPVQLVGVHDIFHVSMLWKYILDPQHIIDYRLLDIKKDVTYNEMLIYILDHKEKVLNGNSIDQKRLHESWKRK